MEEEESDDIVEAKKMKRGEVREMVSNRVKKEEMPILESEEEVVDEIVHSDKEGKYMVEKENEEDEESRQETTLRAATIGPIFFLLVY